MKYFVTGGTGFIGTNVVERLVDDGHDVNVLTRTASNADHLPEAVTVVEGDITDKESLRAPMSSVDGVFHLAAWYFIGPAWRASAEAERINVTGTRNVLELIDELDVPKGVYTSSVAVFGHTGDDVVDETYRPDDPGLCVYYRTKWRAHYEVARPMMDEGTPIVIVQPGAVFGPGDTESGPVREAVVDWLAGDLPALPRGFTLPYDHVDDVARAHLRAMEIGAVGEEYIIAGESREVVEFFDVAAEMTGVPAPRNVSPRLFRLLAAVLAPIERVWRLPKGFEPETFRTYGGTTIRVDSAKARADLGLEFRAFDDGLRDYLRWEFGQQGMDTSALDAEPVGSMDG